MRTVRVPHSLSTRISTWYRQVTAGHPIHFGCANPKDASSAAAVAMPRVRWSPCLQAMQTLIANRASWSGTLIGAFVADEEASSLGAKAYVKTAPKIDYCVIGEPTSCTTVTAHKGSMRPLVRVKGRTAHSGMPDLGINAILKASPLACS